MSDARHYQVVIAGGGLVGASAALALARKGVSVGLFERRFCGAQASGVNYGGVRTQGRSAEQLPLAVRARRVEFWQADRDRLHTRVVYEREADAAGWRRSLRWP